MVSLTSALPKPRAPFLVTTSWLHFLRAAYSKTCPGCGNLCVWQSPCLLGAPGSGKETSAEAVFRPWVLWKMTSGFLPRPHLKKIITVLIYLVLGSVWHGYTSSCLKDSFLVQMFLKEVWLATGVVMSTGRWRGDHWNFREKRQLRLASVDNRKVGTSSEMRAMGSIDSRGCCFGYFYCKGGRKGIFWLPEWRDNRDGEGMVVRMPAAGHIPSAVRRQKGKKADFQHGFSFVLTLVPQLRGWCYP